MKKLTEKVFQSLGQVSMCWSETPKGVFESTEAKKIGEEKKEDPTRCCVCGNPHLMTDNHAGTIREVRRLCITCFNDAEDNI